jgi:cell division protein FtsX
MQKTLATTRTIAVILAIALLVALGVIWNDQSTIKDLKDPNKQNITLQGDVIRQDCTATDATSQAKCADDLQNLSDLLSRFKKSGTSAIQGNVQGSVQNVQVVPVKVNSK